MTWGKIDDQLAFHPKVVQAGNEALGMWVRAMSYSCQMLTGGFISKDMAVAFGGVKVAKRLVGARLWHEVEGGYQFHDWDQYQPCAETEKAKREQTRAARSQAGKAGAKARWDDKDESQPIANAMANGMANGMAKPMANAWQNDAPEPEPISNEVVIATTTTRKTTLKADWKPDEKGLAYARERAPGLNIDVSVDQFINYNLQRGRTSADWGAAWRNWVIKAVEFDPSLAKPLAPPKRIFGAGDNV